MADPYIQDFLGKKTWLDDWTPALAKIGRTITTATVAASAGTITGQTPTTTGIRFRLDLSAVPATSPYIVNVTTTATLDNGDVALSHYQIQVTNT